VVANMVIPAQQANTDFTHARRVMQEKYLNEISERFGLPVAQIPLLPQEIKGLEMLAALGEEIYQNDLAIIETAGK
jgi:arsenite/tail-anchored protein-transporting ATPase